MTTGRLSSLGLLRGPRGLTGATGGTGPTGPTGPGGTGSTRTVATYTALEALTVAGDGLEAGMAYTVQEDPTRGPWVWDTTSGAGLASDHKTAVRLTETDSGDDGVFYNSQGAPVLPTLAALRAAKACKHERVTILCRATLGDKGGGTFIRRTGSTTDDGGIEIAVTGVSSFHYEREYNGTIHTEWFGHVDDVTSGRSGVVSGASSPSNVLQASIFSDRDFTADDVGKAIIIAGGGDPAHTGAGTITANTNTTDTIYPGSGIQDREILVGSGTSFTTDFEIGQVIFWQHNGTGCWSDQIREVIDDTHIRLSANYPIVDVSGARYWTRSTVVTTITGFTNTTHVTVGVAFNSSTAVDYTIGTDQSAAFEAAVAAAKAGDTVEFSEHALLLSALEIGENKPITFQGAGHWELGSASSYAGAANIRRDAASGPVLHFGSQYGIVPRGRCNLRNFVAIGPGMGDSGGYAPSSAGGAIGVTTEDLHFINWRAGWDIDYCNVSFFYNPKATGCAHGFRFGRIVDDVNATNLATWIYGLDVQNCGAGVTFGNGTHINIFGGLNQGNRLDWNFATYDFGDLPGISGISYVTVAGVYEESNRKTFRFGPQNGICRNIAFVDCGISTFADTVTLGDASGTYATMGDISFTRCNLGGVKFVLPEDVDLANIRFVDCSLPADTDRIVIEEPERVTALQIVGSDGHTSEVMGSQVPVSDTVNGYTPNLTAQYGGAHWLLIQDDVPVKPPENAWKGAKIKFIIERTTNTVTWDAVYHNPPTLRTNDVTVVEFVTVDGTEFYTVA